MEIALAAGSICLAGLIWAVFRACLLERALPFIRPREDSGNPDCTDVVVVIPVRNEEANLLATLAGVEGAAVVVADDGSTDGTRRIAEEAGAGVLPVRRLPQSRSPKADACWAAASATSSRWILFLDASVILKTGFLPALVDYAEAKKAIAVSCLLTSPQGNWWARSTDRLLRTVYLAGAEVKESNSSRSPDVLTDGRCLLFRRQPYEFLGGHGAVAGNLLESHALLRRAKRHRMEVHTVRAEGQYRALAHGRDGWRSLRRLAFPLVWETGQRGVRAVAMTFLCGWPLAGVTAWYTGQDHIAAGVLAAGVLIVAVRDRFGLFGVPLLAAGFLASIFTHVLGGRVYWKGRRIPLS